MKNALVILFSTVACVMAAELSIAERGKSAACSIVIAENAIKPYERAAKELQSFIKEITDVELPVVRDNVALPESAILIGANRHSQALMGDEYDLKSLGDDAYVLKAVGKHLVILGGRRGGQYGVYDILERFGACQWYSSWCSKIPKADRFAVPADLNVKEVPAFMMREPFWFDMFNTMQAVRNRCNGNAMRLEEDDGGKIAFGLRSFVHTFNVLLPPEKYFDEHPEYFSEIGGVRRKGYFQLCLSNPDVVRIVTENLKATIAESIEKSPSAKIFSVSQNDTYNECTCKNCLALQKQYGNQAGVLLWFVNQVAEAIEKDYPDVFIETLAYQYTRQPPSNIRPRHNVIMRLCTIECDFSRGIVDSNDPQTVRFVKDIEGWSAMTDKLFVWDYVTTFAYYFSPFPNFGSIQKNIKFFRDNHVVALMSQGDYNGYHADFSELKGWIGAKLMWNPDLDVNAYLDDFFGKDGYYGAAGPIMRKYFDAMQALMSPKDQTLRFFASPLEKWLTDEFLTQGEELFAQAEALVKDDKVHLYNVRKASLSLYLALFLRRPGENVKYVWMDDRMMPTGVSPRTVQIAQELNTRFNEQLGDGVNRYIQIAESKDVHVKTYNSWKRIALGLDVVKEEKNGVSIGAVPEFNGELGKYGVGDWDNVLDGNRGGISYTLNAAKDDAIRTYNVQKHGNGEIAMNYNAVKVDYSIDDDGDLLCEFGGASSSDDAISIPMATFAFALGNERNVCYRLDDGDWKELTASAAFRHEAFFVSAEDLAGKKSISLASPKNGKEVTVALAADRVQNASIQIYPDEGTCVLFVREHKGLKKDNAFTGKYKVTVSKADGLPASVPCTKGLKGIAVESTDIVLIKPGEWCLLDYDDESELGLAVVMTNSFYAWCLRALPKELGLVDGMTYRCRVRIKVDKNPDAPTDIPMGGNAFSTGIYDDTQQLGLVPELHKKVNEIQDGYQWYDLGTFIPKTSNDQWFWAASGVFDINNGQKSAVKRVLVDRITFEPQADK